MFPVLLPSIASVFLVSFLNFLTAKAVFSVYKKKNRDDSFLSLGLGWFFLGTVLFLTGLRTVFFGFGYLSIDKFIFYTGQIIFPFVFVFWVYYLVFIATKNKKISKTISFLLAVLAFVFYYLLFKNGLQGPFVSDWGSEYRSDAANIYLIASILGIVFLFYNIIKEIGKLFLGREFKKYIFFSVLAMLFYTIGAYFEQFGMADWSVLFWRIVLAVSSLGAYFLHDKQVNDIFYNKKSEEQIL